MFYASYIDVIVLAAQLHNVSSVKIVLELFVQKS